MEMKKLVLKLELHDHTDKKRVMRTVSGFSGIDSISMDLKEKKLTVTGDVDPVRVVSKLRKHCCTEIISVGPAKESQQKKEEPKKEEPKKPDDKKKDPINPNVYIPSYYYYVITAEGDHHHPSYYHCYPYSDYHVCSQQEYPNTCVIC